MWWSRSSPFVLVADPMRLAQAFSNLLNNAAKYTENGGTIEVRVEGQPGYVIVSISDNGMG